MPPSSKRRRVTTDRVTNNVDPAETRSESETDISESEEDDVEDIDQQQDTPTGTSSQLNEMDYAYDLMPGELCPTTFLAYKNPYMSGRVIIRSIFFYDQVYTITRYLEPL